LIGSRGRGHLDRLIVLGQRHLRRNLSEYFDYYANCRTHLALDKDARGRRPVEPIAKDEIVAVPCR
jgi:hypothetical protein